MKTLEEKISELREALDFYDRALADKNGLVTGAQRDGHDWVITAARAVASAT